MEDEFYQDNQYQPEQYQQPYGDPNQYQYSDPYQQPYQPQPGQYPQQFQPSQPSMDFNFNQYLGDDAVTNVAAQVGGRVFNDSMSSVQGKVKFQHQNLARFKYINFIIRLDCTWVF